MTGRALASEHSGELKSLERKLPERAGKALPAGIERARLAQVNWVA